MWTFWSVSFPQIVAFLAFQKVFGVMHDKVFPYCDNNSSGMFQRVEL